MDIQNELTRYIKYRDIYNAEPHQKKNISNDAITFNIEEIEQTLKEMTVVVLQNNIQLNNNKNVNKNGKHNLRVITFKFDKNHRSRYEYNAKRYIFDEKSYHDGKINEWSYWEDVFLMLNVDWGSQEYEDKHYMLFGEGFYRILWSKYAEIMKEQIRNRNDWYNNERPELNNKLNVIGFNDDNVFAQKVVINNPNSKIVLIGDIHSSFHSLYDIMNDIRHMFNGNSMTLLDNNYIIFLGDIVDRGPYGLELLAFIYLLKIKNKDNVFIINGNHEDFSTYMIYGLGKEKKYQINDHKTYKNKYGYDYDLLDQMLFYLPSVIYLKFDDIWYHLSHGGISYKDTMPNNRGNIDVNIKDFLNDKNAKYYYIKNVSNDGHETGEGFKWDDFDQTIDNPIFNKSRGAGYKYGPNTVKKYLETNNISCIISGHQDNIKLGLLVDNNDISNDELMIDNYTFKMCSKDRHCNYHYNLYAPCEYVNGNCQYDNDKRHHINLNPGNDFLALVTSTSTVSKNVPANTYLILENKN